MAKSKQPVDLDRKQTLKDVYRPNQYKLDDRFVLPLQKSAKRQKNIKWI